MIKVRSGLISTLLTMLVMLQAQLPVQAAMRDYSSEREQFIQARKTLRNGDLQQFERYAKGLEDYPLYVYLRYDYLRPRLHQVSNASIREFLATYTETPLNRLLRKAWLERLARQQRWDEYLQDYADVGSTELECHYVSAGLRRSETAELLEQAKELWLTGESRPSACDPAFELLYDSPLMTDALLWQRIQLAMEAGRPQLAAYLGKRLDKEQQALVRLWQDMRSHPLRTLATQKPGAGHPRRTEIIAYGLQRLAVQNFNKALQQWLRFERNTGFSAEQRGQIMRSMALGAERHDHDDVLVWLDQVPEHALDERIHRLRLSRALKHEDWAALLRWTQADLPNIPNPLRWQYWQARALEANGQIKEAIQQYRQLSEHRDYYGFMASDRLGVGYRMNVQKPEFSGKELEQVAAIPAITRAYEFYRLDEDYPARREWHYALKGMLPSDMQVASVLAHDWGWHDRAIITLGKARAFDDLERRFPLPWQETILKYAKRRSLPASFIYSIIRSESAFMEDARSPKGALGLMQLMPTTGKQTAKQIKVKLRRTHDLMKAEKNIPIGTAYMRQMLDRFDGNLAMAAGAYNAGPHRVKAWQPRDACMPAEIWVEMVPFTETRRYIRRALFYSAIYEWRLNLDVQPLESKLVAIPASGTTPKKMGCTFKQPDLYGML